MTATAAWDDRARAVLPRPAPGFVRSLALLPVPLRRRAAAAWLRARPLARSAEEDLVAEVARCWQDAVLPLPLPDLVDAARLSMLLLLVEARAAACDGPDRVGRHLRIDGLARIDELLASHRLVVLLTPSFGPWTTIAPALARRGRRVALIDQRPPNRRPGLAFPAAPGLDLRCGAAPSKREPADPFDGGPGLVVVLADEGLGPRWASGSFLGREASVGALPFDLARTTGAALLPVCTHEERGVRRLLLDAPIAAPASARQRDLDAAARRWLKGVERRVRRDPDHYLPFLFSRWLGRYGDPRPLFADAIPPRDSDAAGTRTP
jgi:lauroyl/myristoyl acyltransferase